MQGFTAKQVGQAAEIAYDTLDYWARSGFLTPSIALSAGTGTMRRWSFNDIVAARVAQELRAEGVPLQSLRRVVAFLREAKGLEHPLAGTRLFVAASDVLLVNSDEELLSLLAKPGQYSLIYLLAIGRTVARVREEVDRLVPV